GKHGKKQHGEHGERGTQDDPRPPQSSDPGGTPAGDGGVVFFPTGAIATLQAKAARSPFVRARFDEAVGSAHGKAGSKPGPVEEIKREGVLRGERDTGKIIGDFATILDFALAGALTGESSFFDDADRHLVAWANTYPPDGNPIDE